MSPGDPVAAVRQCIDAFNKGDAKRMAATFTVPSSILDGMAPHLWQGPSAPQDWYRDVLIEGKLHDASDYFVTLGEPLHNNITGDSAYVMRTFMQIAGDIAPDVVFVNFKQSHTYISMKLLYPLDVYVEQLAGVSVSDGSSLSLDAYLNELKR